ncbi:MAG: tetratricopeptide repeat protein [Gammaproteobacteria bacterium]
MTTDPKRWQQINSLLRQAIELPVAEQAAFVTGEAGEDTDLASEVMVLLAFDSEKTGNIRESIESVASDLRTSDDTRYIGQQVGQYRITSKLEEGGMGSVFVAQHTAPDFEQTVAIKLTPKHRFSKDAHRRFIEERRILAGLNHPNIAPLIDGGTLQDGTPYIVMEYIKGVAIDQYCADNNLGNDDIISLIRSVCSALQYAHRKLIIHRDIKPSNILVTSDGTPKLLDFGIAKLMDADADLNLTRAEQRILTPMYASPEQLEGVPITTAADVYGIGLLLYRLLTGQMPYVPTGATPRDFEIAILSQTPKRPSTAVLSENTLLAERTPGWFRRQQKALRGELDTILLTALQKQPERRYESIAAFSDDLKRFQQNLPITAQPDSTLYVLRKFLRRNRWPVGVATAVVAGGIAMASYYTGQLRIERDLADQTAGFLTDLFQANDPYVRNKKEGLSVDALVDEGLAKLEDESELVPEVRVRLFSVISQVKRNLGELESAEQMARKALALAESHTGRDSELVLPALGNLVKVRTNQEDYVEATQLAERWFKLSEKVHGNKSPDVAQAAHLLSTLAYRTADLEAMKKWAHHSYDLRNDIYPPNSKERAVGANSMGLYYWQADDLVSARQYYEEAAAINQAQPDRNYMREANMLHNIGLLYNDSGDYKEAINRYTQSVELRRRGASPNDHIMPLTLYALAHSQSKFGDMVAAHRTFMQQLPLQAAVAGREKPLVAYSLTGHGMLLEEMGHYEDAKRLLEEADRIFAVLPDPQHPDRAATWIGLGRLASHLNEWSRAEGLMQQALTLRQEKKGASDMSTIRAQIALGRVVFLSGDLNRSKDIISEAQLKLVNEQQEEHPFMAEAAALQGRIALAAGDATEAIASFEKARNLLADKLPESHHLLAQYAVWNAEALAAAGRQEEAENIRSMWLPILSAEKVAWQQALQAYPVPIVDDFLTVSKTGT